MVVIQETRWTNLRPLLGLNQDPGILVLRQEFLDFVPGWCDSLDNPQRGEAFLVCHKNGITTFSLLVEAVQIQRQRLGVVDFFLLALDLGEW